MTSSTALSIRPACLLYPRCRSIKAAERIDASGFAIDFPAMSGALPWTLSIMKNAQNVTSNEGPFSKWRPIAELGGKSFGEVPQKRFSWGGSLYPCRIWCYAYFKMELWGEGPMRVRQHQVFISFDDRWVSVTVANKAHGDCTPGDQRECRWGSGGIQPEDREGSFNDTNRQGGDPKQYVMIKMGRRGKNKRQRVSERTCEGVKYIVMYKPGNLRFTHHERVSCIHRRNEAK